MNRKKLFSLLALALMPASVMLAQSIYDDDIYYNPKNDKKAKTVAVPAKTVAVVDTVADFPSADTYTVVTGSTRSVDEYNRRGIFAVSDTTVAATDSTALDDFVYTRRIEQFYNPSVVTSSDDAELAKLYYAEPANINIYVESPDYWGWGYPYYSYNYWGYPWYGSSWYWNSWYAPSWSWSWGWGPAWGSAWGPGWGWSWGWGGVPARPYNPRHPGALTRPGHAGGVTAAGSGYRPGAAGRHPGTRPASTLGSGTYRPSTSGGTDTYRPSTGGNATRPGANGNYSRPSNNNNNTSRPTYNNNNNNTSRPSYNNNNSGSYSRPGRSSGGSFGGGGGGGRHSGAGGGGRGGRR